MPERIAAKAAGERFYSTGKPCANGHISKRYTASGICAECAIKNTIKSTANAPWHPERQAAKERGDIHYSTGRPCRNGHAAMRYVHNGQCVECRAAAQVRFHEAHPAIGAEWARKRRAKNPEPHRQANSKWAKKNPESVRAATQRAYAKEPEKWRKRKVAYTQNHNARKTANGGSFTDADINALFLAQDGKCAGCGHSKKLEVDHILPIARGGRNGPPNLQLLCRSCNASKRDKTMEEWVHWLATVTK